MFNKVKDTVEILRIENKLINILFKMNIIQFILIVVLVIGLISLFPLKEKEPYLVQFSNAEMNFAVVRKADEAITKDEAIRQSLAISYVHSKETKNNIDDFERHEKVRLQSSFDVWQQHKAIVNDEKSIFQKKDLTRTINIITVNLFPNTNVAQIDFRATIKRGDNILDEADFRAVISYEFSNNEKIKFNDIAKNPLVYKVTAYNLSKISQTEKKDKK
uniref:VirB8 n=1 Tax=Aliarcobacter butzleri TaxID=28197 RepID=W0LW41_9BACT|nr:VirB8/TrbF family protein [Aliarcobacter butzleri]AHG28756.1 VirB8 [Aliarcobacter butzleri]